MNTQMHVQSYVHKGANVWGKCPIGEMSGGNSGVKGSGGNVRKYTNIYKKSSSRCKVGQNQT